jgi:hypothetical protein
MSLQGQGQGGILLADAVERIVVATRTVAARIVVVDALHERAVTFYEHCGFNPIPGTLRLVKKVSDVAAALKPRRASAADACSQPRVHAGLAGVEGIEPLKIGIERLRVKHRSASDDVARAASGALKRRTWTRWVIQGFEEAVEERGRHASLRLVLTHVTTCRPTTRQTSRWRNFSTATSLLPTRD